MSRPPVTGLTKDRNAFPTARFDSVPAMGLQILGAAAARDLGFISPAGARTIAETSARALLAIEKHPDSGLLPHWLLEGIRHPNSEWSSVDTAIACIAGVEGLTALGMTSRVEDVYAQIVDQIDFSTFTLASNEISHGFDRNGKLIENTWNQWGGELTLVEVLRAMQKPTLDPVTAARDVEHYCGRGFIIEIAALFLPHFGMTGFGRDQYGVDWHQRRVQQMNDQAAFTGTALFGLSSVEIMRHDTAETAYLAGGIGNSHPPCDALQTLDGYGPGPWVAPHYLSMVAALDYRQAEQRIVQMRDTFRIWPCLNGPPEAVQLAPDGTPAKWHRFQGSLNAAFNVLGLYHAICLRDTRRDQVYQAAASDARLAEAAVAVFSGPPTPGA